MTTAVEYQQYARECTISAREAATDPVRDHFLELAKLWLTAAARMDAEVASSEETNPKGNGQYRHHAVACIKQSETVTKSDEKALWLKVATEWDRMATAADRNPAAF